MSIHGHSLLSFSSQIFPLCLDQEEGVRGHNVLSSEQGRSKQLVRNVPRMADKAGKWWKKDLLN